MTKHRDRHLTCQGWLVLRFPAGDLLAQDFWPLKEIVDYLKGRGIKP